MVLPYHANPGRMGFSEATIARREVGETLRDLPGPTLLVAFNMTS